jgi:hypothetical protein
MLAWGGRVGVAVSGGGGEAGIVGDGDGVPVGEGKAVLVGPGKAGFAWLVEVGRFLSWTAADTISGWGGVCRIVSPVNPPRIKRFTTSRVLALEKKALIRGRKIPHRPSRRRSRVLVVLIFGIHSS